MTGHFLTHFEIWPNKVQFCRTNLLYISMRKSLTMCNNVTICNNGGLNIHPIVEFFTSLSLYCILDNTTILMTILLLVILLTTQQNNNILTCTCMRVCTHTCIHRATYATTDMHVYQGCRSRPCASQSTTKNYHTKCSSTTC